MQEPVTRETYLTSKELCVRCEEYYAQVGDDAFSLDGMADYVRAKMWRDKTPQAIVFKALMRKNIEACQVLAAELVEQYELKTHDR